MNAVELTDLLSEQIVKLRNGEAEPKTVNAIVNAAGRLLATQRLLLEYAKMTRQTPHTPFLSLEQTAQPPQIKSNGEQHG